MVVGGVICCDGVWSDVVVYAFSGLVPCNVSCCGMAFCGLVCYELFCCRANLCGGLWCDRCWSGDVVALLSYLV